MVEQAVPPCGMAVSRKVWGASHTERGAQTQQILVSLLATCQQRDHSAQAALIGLPRSPELRPLDLSAADLPPPRTRAARCQLGNLAAYADRARRNVAGRQTNK